MIAPTMIATPKATSAFVRPSARMTSRKIVVVRAAEETPEAPKAATESADATVFYQGNNYNNEEWKQAVATGTVKPAPASPVAAAAPSMTLATALNFDQAPELINGRLAMLAFVAALGAELSSNESVFRQFGDAKALIILTAVTFTAASLIPMLSGAKREAFGPFSPDAEMLNGRAAMLGFASLLVVEAVRHQALF